LTKFSFSAHIYKRDLCDVTCIIGIIVSLLQSSWADGH